VRSGRLFTDTPPDTKRIFPAYSVNKHTLKANTAMKILFIYGSQVAHEKLKQLLADQPEVEVLEEAIDTPSGLGAISDLGPDVVVIDLQMPLRSATETVRRMLSLNPNLKIIALSMYSDRRYVDECLQAGACGYLLKECAYEELVDAVRMVTSDRQYLSPSVRPHYS
jgi:DNA-binding NarL/FixJ family response regulator